MADRSLEQYHGKRDPAPTPEPFGGTTVSATSGMHRFVVQQHAARRMQWDLRLEINGVLETEADVEAVLAGRTAGG